MRLLALNGHFNYADLQNADKLSYIYTLKSVIAGNIWPLYLTGFEHDAALLIKILYTFKH